MTDIFDEVEEDVRKERWEQLWKKYGNYAMIGAAAVILGVAGYRGWQAYQHHLNEQASESYLAAQQLAQAGNLVAAEAAFGRLVEDSPSGYTTIAKFAEAAVLLSENKREAALTLLRELTSASDPVLANVARLQIAWVEADFAPKSEIQSTLAPLLAPDNPFRFAASEVLAYTALRLGARSEAVAAYEKLAKETGAPAGVRQRASALAEYLTANPDITSLPLASAPPTLAPTHAPAPVTAPATTPATAPATAPATTSAPAAPAPAPAPESHP